MIDFDGPSGTPDGSINTGSSARGAGRRLVARRFGTGRATYSLPLVRISSSVLLPTIWHSAARWDRSAKIATAHASPATQEPFTALGLSRYFTTSSGRERMTI